MIELLDIEVRPRLLQYPSAVNPNVSYGGVYEIEPLKPNPNLWTWCEEWEADLREAKVSVDALAEVAKKRYRLYEGSSVDERTNIVEEVQSIQNMFLPIRIAVDEEQRKDAKKVLEILEANPMPSNFTAMISSGSEELREGLKSSKRRFFSPRQRKL